MPVPDFKNVAAQLRQPTGDDGSKTAEYMGINNRNMIERTIDLAALNNGDKILEVGYGGGLHLPYLFAKANDLQYTGIDISATMQEMAIVNNKNTAGTYSFLQADLKDGYLPLPFDDHSFDKIFSVNTIYFWDNAPAQSREIYRVLKPGGCFAVSFGSRVFMQELPFTQYGFELYDAEKAAQLLTGNAFCIKGQTVEEEIVPGIAGDGLKREIIIIRAGKA